MRRLTAVIAAFSAALFLCLNVCAEGDENLLAGYENLMWSGAPLEYNSEHKTLSFAGNGGGEAYIEFPAGDARGLWFYADLGNYSGGGACGAAVAFLDKDGGEIALYKTDKTAPDGSFRRFQLGREEEYLALPEDTAAVRVSLSADAGDSPYFRNLSLILSGTHIVGGSAEWAVSGKLGLVQVKSSKSQYIIWTGIVVSVPLMLFALRKMIDRAKRVK